jgi:hypothetical protein
VSSPMAATSTPIIVHLFFKNFISNPQNYPRPLKLSVSGLCRIRPSTGLSGVNTG